VVAVRWNRDEPTIIVQDRTQKRVVILSVDEVTGQTTIVYTKSDDTWVELIPGLPTWTSDGKLLDAPDAEVRRLQLDGRDVTGADLEIRKFIGETSSGGLVYLASSDPRETHVWISDGRNDTKLSDFPGVFDASVGGQTVAVFGSSIGDYPLLAECVSTSADFRRYTLRSNSAKVSIAPCPQFFRTELRGINYGLLVPKGFKGDRVLPILMDPYGGPLVQRCIKSTLSFTTSQWFADQGFAVLVGDGRGTPGRGRGWEKAIAGNLILPILDDQIAILDHAIEANPFLDQTKVAVRGWSFGGYLAILAVLLRPDRFHAAIGGAPVTDWRNYDTHYTERYLGNPDQNQFAYDACSAISIASRLTRPLLLIHGISDDNVFFAHTLQLSKALFEAGRPHNLLPITDITHMAESETAAENLLLSQLEFLKQKLGLEHMGG
jgi:dipeptidyl-peptidase-4